MRSWLVSAAFGVVLATVCTSIAAAGCDPAHRADLPVTLKSRKALVPARINGTDVQLIVDSGATWNGLSTASAKSLGIDEQAGTAVRSASVSGQAVEVRLAPVKSFALAGRDVGLSQFLVGGALANVGAAGRLGGNTLGAAAAIEYDLPDGTIRLFADEGCEPQQLAQWVGDPRSWSARIEPMEPRRPQVRAEVTVNGVPVHLVVDTAAPYSSLSREAATRAHVDLSPGAVEAAGQGQDVRSGALMTIVKARVAGLTFGSERQADVSVRISI